MWRYQEMDKPWASCAMPPPIPGAPFVPPGEAIDYRPMIALNQLADNLWEYSHPYRPLGFEIGHRMTAVRLSTGPDAGGLWVHSPTPLDGPTRIALAAQGSIHWVVVPSHFHDMYLDGYFASYPATKFAGVAGFAERHPELAFTHALDDPDTCPWSDEILWQPLAGMPNVNEAVFLHRPSRTLIVADMVFNFRAGNLRTRAMMRLNGAWGDVAASRFFKSRVADRAALRSSVKRVLEWDFDRIVVGHGDVVPSAGRQAIEGAFRWLLH